MAEEQKSSVSGFKKTLIAVIAVVGLVAVLIVLRIASQNWHTKEHVPPLQVELFKTALQFLGVAIVGGAVAFLFKDIEKRQEEDRVRVENERVKARELAEKERDKDRERVEKERDKDRERAEKAREEALSNRSRDLDTVRTFALEVLAVYNNVKLARRVLRFHAYQSGNHDEHFLVIDDRYYDSFLTLQNAQLDLERLYKQITLRGSFFDKFTDVTHFSEPLKNSEKYIRSVLKEFESGIHHRSSNNRVILANSQLAAFFASKEDRKRLRISNSAEKAFFEPMWELQDSAIEMLTPAVSESS